MQQIEEFFEVPSGLTNALVLGQPGKDPILRHPDVRPVDLEYALLDLGNPAVHRLAVEHVVANRAVTAVAVPIEVIDESLVTVALRVPKRTSSEPTFVRRHMSNIGSMELKQF